MSDFFDRLWGKAQQPPPEPDPDLPLISQTNVPETSAKELKALLASPEPPFVLDVREPYEWPDGVIPGAAQIPMNSIPARLDELPRDRAIVAYCHIGERSWYVAEFLLRNGFTNVSHLTGGIEAWWRQRD
ncbi:MAG: rhodanese-like domain-containing protein [Chloroflexi bacterium]|nr:rhodanese-like domain-containing protein [Chloroflexota bacterium]